MSRTLSFLRRRIREELRAEGPDGGGYSDFFLDQQINSAIGVLSAIYPIRDTFTFDTVEDQDEYNMDDIVDDDMDVDKIIKLTYDDTELPGSRLDSMLYNSSLSVYGWTLWGRTIILYGEEIEADKEVKIWVTRAPQPLVDPEDESELPQYTDEAIIQFVIAACYRESRDYERATTHYHNFLHHEDRLRKRDIPQGHRAYPTQMSNIYSQPVRHSRTRTVWDDIQ